METSDLRNNKERFKRMTTSYYVLFSTAGYGHDAESAV